MTKKIEMVVQDKVFLAEAVKIAQYRVFNPETESYDEPQIHMTINNTVIAVMPISAAKLIAEFISND